MNFYKYLFILMIVCLMVGGVSAEKWGITTIGASYDYYAQKTNAANLTAPSDIGTLLSINYYSNDTAGTHNLKCAMWYLNNTIVANSVTGVIDMVDTTPAWRYANFSVQPVITAGTVYRVGCIASDTYNNYYYDVGPGVPTVFVYGTADYTTPADLTITSNANRNMSIYVEYTLTGSTPDTTPPNAVSNLVNETPGMTSIKFNWVNPVTSDFNRTNIYKDGVFQYNLSNITTTTTFTGLTGSTAYAINITTEDLAGNRNTTHWQNLSATTAAASESTTLVINASNKDVMMYVSSAAPINITSILDHSPALSTVSYTTAFTRITTNTELNTWKYIYEYWAPFNTTDVDESMDITAMYVDYWGTGKSSSLGTNQSVVISRSLLEDAPNVSASDWYSKENTIIANNISYGDFNASGYNRFTFTHPNQALNFNCWTAYVVRDSAAYNRNFEGAFVASTLSTFGFLSADNVAAKPPRLTIVYQTPVAVPVPDFYAVVTSGSKPFTVQLYDISSGGVTGRNWSFGNGGNYSTDINPSFTFTDVGLFNVTLTATNAIGSNSTTQVNYINVTPSHPIAQFSASPLTGAPPLLVTFTDESTETPTSWLWDFGDGVTSTEQNPTHTYTSNGYWDVSLTATNVYGATINPKHAYIRSAQVPVRGAHPYLFFHNISEVTGFNNRTVTPFSTWETTILTSANSAKAVADWNSTAISTSTRSKYAKNSALYYHICSNTGGSNCQLYANAAISALSTMDIRFAIDRAAAPVGCAIPLYDTRLWDGHFSQEYLRDYAIAYDLVNSTKDGGSTTLTTALDISIRDKLAIHMNDTYTAIPYYNGCYSPSSINFVDRLGGAYPAMGIVGEVLYDYNTTGKGLATTPVQWSSMLDYGLFTNGVPHTGQYIDEGVAFNQINKSGGMFVSGAYTGYYLESWAYIPTVYSRIYGNVFDNNPGFKNYYLAMANAKHPNGYFANYQTMGSSMLDTASGGLKYLSGDDYNTVKWSIEKSNQSYVEVLLPNGRAMGSPDDTILYLSSDYNPTPAAAPTDKVWLTDTFAVMRTSWDENADWISFTARQDPVGSNRPDGHNDQMGVEFFGHGDNTMPDGGEIKYIGIFSEEQADVMHNIIMIGNPRTPFVNHGGYSAPYHHYMGTNLTSRGAGSLATNPAYVTTKIDTPTMGYIGGRMMISTVPDAGVTSLSSPVAWERGIVSPNNEYFVVADRTSGSETWLYKSHWQFGSVRIDNPGVYYETLTGITTAVNGSLVIGGDTYDWKSLPFWTETDTGITTNTIQWNTTNERGVPVSTKIFSAPASLVSTFKYMARVGGYSSPNALYNHETTNPHIFFNSPENTTGYRVTAILPAWASEITIPTTTELTVTGTGSAIKVISADGTKTDTIYTGSGNNTFNNFTTNADTAFIRKKTNITDYTLINSTWFSDGTHRMYNSTKVLNYIVYNKSAGVTSVNISGTSGSTNITFYTDAPTYVKIDGTTVTTWFMRDNTTLDVFTTLSDHNIEFNGGEPGGGEEPGSDPVIASFIAAPLYSAPPSLVQFTDTSTNTPTSWIWYFGDFGPGNTSPLQNPTHWYNTTGSYTIILNASNVDSYSFETKINYIVIANDTSSTGARRTAMDIQTFIIISVILLTVVSVIVAISKLFIKNDNV